VAGHIYREHIFYQNYFKALVREIAEVHEVEIGRVERFGQLNRFVEIMRADFNAAQAMPLVQEHLGLCGECHEDSEALLASPRTTEEI